MRTLHRATLGRLTVPGTQLRIRSTDVLARHVRPGSRAEKRQATRDWIKQQVRDALGEDFSFRYVDCDYDETTGEPLLLLS